MELLIKTTPDAWDASLIINHPIVFARFILRRVQDLRGRPSRVTGLEFSDWDIIICWTSLRYRVHKQRAMRHSQQQDLARPT
eukprot:scaffold205888_cov17-Prasinocladus_malaysianus.AAC.1